VTQVEAARVLSYGRKLVTHEGVRRRIVGVFNASTSPAKE
jgi:hypothetical protein